VLAVLVASELVAVEEALTDINILRSVDEAVEVPVVPSVTVLAPGTVDEAVCSVLVPVVLVPVMFGRVEEALVVVPTSPVTGVVVDPVEVVEPVEVALVEVPISNGREEVTSVEVPKSAGLELATLPPEASEEEALKFEPFWPPVKVISI